MRFASISSGFPRIRSPVEIVEPPMTGSYTKVIISILAQIMLRALRHLRVILWEIVGTVRLMSKTRESTYYPRLKVSVDDWWLLRAIVVWMARS